jgi:hypothetical protein
VVVVVVVVCKPISVLSFGFGQAEQKSFCFYDPFKEAHH